MSVEKNRIFFLHLIVMMVIMIGFRFLPPLGEITPGGMQILGVFIGGIYGWITIGLLLPSLLGMLVAGFTDVITTTEFFTKAFGSQIFVLVMGMMILAAFISQNNLAQVIIRTLMSLKISRGRPWVTVLCFFYAIFAVASVTNSTISAVLCITLYIQMAADAKLPQYNRLNTAMITGMAFSALMGDCTLPFQNTVILVSGAYHSVTGINLDLGLYLLSFLPWAMFMIAVYVLFCKYVLRIDASALLNVNMNYGGENVTKRQMISIGFILLTLVLLVLPNFLPEGLFLKSFLQSLGLGGTVLLALFIMAIVQIDGEAILNIQQAAKGISWDILFMIAYYFPVASILTSDATGIKATITTVLTPILSGLSPILIVIVIAVSCVIFTNFLNNMLVAALMTSTVGLMSDFLGGISLAALVLVIIFCCNIAYILPSSCPTNAYFYSQRELIRFNTQFMHALVVGIVMLVITIILGLPWFSLFF